MIEDDNYVNELDFTEEEKKFFEIRGMAIQKRFENKNIPCHLMYVSTEVYGFIEEFISQRPEIKNIAFSDGVTLYQLDLFNWVKIHIMKLMVIPLINH